MPELAMSVEGLSKRYRIGVAEERHDTLLGGLAAALKSPLRNYRRLRDLARFGDGSAGDVIWALDDVSFQVNQGEVVGVIGANGAGKSTLLKILSRITEPTKGQARIAGRVSSLLEVGTGFHGDLTGRENVYLNGTILGMRKREIDAKFDQIVEFSGVGKFIDTPVKRYSSGMTVRLAFSVAAHLEPENLLIDEVLAVGDAQFQKKCLGKMEDVASQGRTVLFVSHNMGAVQGLCPRTIWINGGRIVADGDTEEVVSQYLDSSRGAEINLTVKGERYDRPRMVIERVALKNAQGHERGQFAYGEDVELEMVCHAPQPIERPMFWCAIGANSGLFGANMIFDNMCPPVLEGRQTLGCIFRNVQLLPGTYSVHLGVRDSKTMRHMVPPSAVLGLRITGSAEEIGMAGAEAHNHFTRFSPVVRPYAWRWPDGSIKAPHWAAPGAKAETPR